MIIQASLATDLVAHDLAALHDKAQALKLRYVAERITRDRDDVCEFSGLFRPSQGRKYNCSKSFGKPV
jgi:hypothetical protein